MQSDDIIDMIHVIRGVFRASETTYCHAFQVPYISLYNPSNIFARARLVKTRHVTQYAPTKIGEYPSDIPQFK